MTKKINYNEQNRFSERLKFILGDESVNSFALKCGLKEGSIRQYLSGSIPGIDKIAAIADATNYSLEWLIRGEGPMLRKELFPDRASYDPSKFILVPYYNAYLAAGAGALNHDTEVTAQIPVEKFFLEEIAGVGNTKKLAFLEVRGDSMLPTIGDGDIALIDLKQINIREDIMAFVYEDESYIKRIRKMAKGIDIISDNKDLYPPFHIEAESMDRFHIIGKVLSVNRSF